MTDRGATPSAVEVPRIQKVFEAAGVRVDTVGKDIVKRLWLLDAITPIVEDEYRAIKYAKTFFARLEASAPSRAFTEGEKRIVLIGTLFSDIGKTGPKSASFDQQKQIAEMFRIENVSNPKMTVAQFLRDYFPVDHEARSHTLSTLGIDTEMSMRTFWNLHSVWTLQIISGDGVPPEAVAAAATHHMLEGVNPDLIVGKDGIFARYFGENVAFDRAEKLLIIVDKYDALRRRAGKSHDEAIAELRNIVSRNAAYAGDPQFETLIEDFARSM